MTGPLTIKLGEFSLARDQECFKYITSNSQGMCYISPEILSGDQKVSLKTDSWSFGCVFFEIVFLEKAFYDSDLNILRNKINNRTLNYPNVTSEQFKSIIEKYIFILFLNFSCKNL